MIQQCKSRQDISIMLPCSLVINCKFNSYHLNSIRIYHKCQWAQNSAQDVITLTVEHSSEMVCILIEYVRQRGAVQRLSLFLEGALLSHVDKVSNPYPSALEDVENNTLKRQVDKSLIPNLKLNCRNSALRKFLQHDPELFSYILIVTNPIMWLILYICHHNPVQHTIIFIRAFVIRSNFIDSKIGFFISFYHFNLIQSCLQQIINKSSLPCVAGNNSMNQNQNKHFLMLSQISLRSIKHFVHRFQRKRH